jgi:hypothetical protein
MFHLLQWEKWPPFSFFGLCFEIRAFEIGAANGILLLFQSSLCISFLPSLGQCSFLPVALLLLQQTPIGVLGFSKSFRGF